MKHRVFLLALALTGCVSSSFAGDIESFANANDTVCLEVQGNRFGLSIETANRAHEVLGNGALEKKGNLLRMEYRDSFGNKVKGTFDPKSGVLDLQSVKGDLGSPSATAAAYGHYVLSRKKCTSNVLD